MRRGSGFGKKTGKVGFLVGFSGFLFFLAKAKVVFFFFLGGGMVIVYF